MLTALALVHLAALPNKMAMAQAAYFVSQQIYAGWALLASRKKKSCAATFCSIRGA
jgi:hypothetical protein